MKYCNKCNAPAFDEQNFCQKCGNNKFVKTLGTTERRKELITEKAVHTVKDEFSKTVNKVSHFAGNGTKEEKAKNIFAYIKEFFTVRFVKFIKNYKKFKFLPKKSKIKHICFPLIVLLLFIAIFGQSSENNLDDVALNIAYQQNCQYGYSCEKVEIKDKDGYGRYIIYHRAVNTNGNVDMGFDFIVVSKNGNYYTNTLIDLDINAKGLNYSDYKTRSDIKWGEPLSEMGIDGIE